MDITGLSVAASVKVFRIAMTTMGLTLTLAPWPLPSFSQVTDLTPSLQAETLVMGTEADYIPFEFRYAAEPESGIVGFDIEVAKAIADRLGFTLQIQEWDFDALLPAVQAGEIDFAIAAITPTPERRQYLDFSEAYFESRHALVSRRSDPVRTLMDLPGRRVAVQRGSIQEQAALKLVQDGLALDVQSFTQVNEMITAVRNQAVDAAIVEELVAEAYLENNPTLELDVLGEIPPTPVAIAFPQGSPYVAQFNQVLQEMEARGELEELARLWFSADH